MDYTVHGILRARILEWVDIHFSRESSQPRDQIQVSRIAGRVFTSWATREAPHAIQCWTNGKIPDVHTAPSTQGILQVWKTVWRFRRKEMLTSKPYKCMCMPTAGMYPLSPHGVPASPSHWLLSFIHPPFHFCLSCSLLPTNTWSFLMQSIFAISVSLAPAREGSWGLTFSQADCQGSLPMHVCMLSRFSHVCLFATPWTAACQAPLSMGFSRQEYWSGLPCPPPGDLPDPGIEPMSLCLLHWQAGSLPLAPPGKSFSPHYIYIYIYMYTVPSPGKIPMPRQ